MLIKFYSLVTFSDFTVWGNSIPGLINIWIKSIEKTTPNSDLALLVHNGRS